ncbi:unnamed protein product [Cylicostephanus goldi]|uniref:Uncharacterized protein n=1 Tax=Cylicostephanus goldi TaxID=71465 RepID=A0A3P7LQI4_CYLGO|nr:unnamed protein product [Cylicostephanus goldi]
MANDGCFPHYDPSSHGGGFDFTLVDISEKLRMDDDTLKDGFSLLANLRCSYFQRPNSQRERKLWYCYGRLPYGPNGNNKPSATILCGSLLSQCRIPAKVFALSYFWVRELGLVKNKMHELGIRHTSIVQ